MNHKSFSIEKSQDGWLVASTPDRDRDRDRVFPRGLDLTNFLKNPVLMFGHNYQDPWSLIGKVADFQIDDTGFRIMPELRQPASDTDPMHIIRSLWDSGYLKAASIGFNPIEYKPNTDGGVDITKAELLEVSLVPIPANQEALRRAIKAIDTTIEPLRVADVKAEPEPEQPVVEEKIEPQPEEPKAEEKQERESESRLMGVISQFLTELQEYLNG